MLVSTQKQSPLYDIVALVISTQLITNLSISDVWLVLAKVSPCHKD